MRWGNWYEPLRFAGQFDPDGAVGAVVVVVTADVELGTGITEGEAPFALVTVDKVELGAVLLLLLLVLSTEVL